MRLGEQARQTDSHTGARQLGHLTSTTTRGGAKWVAALQRVGDVENHRRVAGDLFITLKPSISTTEVVIAEVRAAVAQNHLIVTALMELIHNIAHLTRAYELRLFTLITAPVFAIASTESVWRARNAGS